MGTFRGVFIPSILTILGVILFLRLGYVVGGSGLEQALLVIAAANFISLLTSLSVAAISTNIRVKRGGDYYLISRTLGLGYGGAIGLVLFLAQSVSVGFYCIGFAEAVASSVPGEAALVVRGIALAALAPLFMLAWLGADWATRFQYLVMAAIIAALTTFAVGAFSVWDTDRLTVNFAKDEDRLPFWIAFSIFFPAITGFTQGISMSGDLANPGQSIPRGILSAVLLSALVYLGSAILLAGALPSDVLLGDTLAMRRVALHPALIDAGVLAAALSSAMASFLGGPRILQALAADNVFPMLGRFSQVSGPFGNPRPAVILTACVAGFTILLGDLNLVAAVVSMFFLISYGLLNYATYLESKSSSPSFRPTFRLYSPWVGLLGALSCVGAMLAIDILSAMAALGVMFLIYQYLEYRGVPARWTDSRRSYHLAEARGHLLAASASDESPRDWRPQLLIFSDTAERRARLLQFASWVEGGSGLTTIVRIITSRGSDAFAEREQALDELRTELRQGASTAFPLIVAGQDLDQTVSTIVQSVGVGPIRANTAVLNWTSRATEELVPEGVGRFSRNLRQTFRFGCNLLVLDGTEKEWELLTTIPPGRRLIDVWWRGNRTGELMLLLAHLMTRASDWQDARIRLVAERRACEAPEAALERMKSLLEAYRIHADVVFSDMTGESIVETSHGSALVFLPFSIHGDRFYGPTGSELGDYLDRLPIAVLTLAAQDVDLDADPDENGAASGTRRDADGARPEQVHSKAANAGL